jgi:hypothetical protein
VAKRQAARCSKRSRAHTGSKNRIRVRFTQAAQHEWQDNSRVRTIRLHGLHGGNPVILVR